MRHANKNWNLPDNLENWEQVNSAILMDIRDELKRMNNIFHCSNALDIPNILRRIDKNTRKVKRKKKTT